MSSTTLYELHNLFVYRKTQPGQSENEYACMLLIVAGRFLFGLSPAMSNNNINNVNGSSMYNSRGIVANDDVTWRILASGTTRA